MNFRRQLAQYLMTLAQQLVAAYGPDVVTAITNVVFYHQKAHTRKIEELIAAYYQSTNIPPEDAIIVLEKTATGWEIFIDPKPQDFEEPEHA
jgi:hypothetical protein